MVQPSSDRALPSQIFMRSVFMAFGVFFLMMVFWPWIALEPTQRVRKAGLTWDAMLSVYDPKQVIRTGETIYDLEAHRLRILNEDSAEVLLTRPRMMATNQDGSWMIVTARAGLYNEESKILQLIADVRIQDARGSDLQTESAVVRMDSRLAEGFSAISGKMGKMINVQAGGFRADGFSANYEFLGATEMTFDRKKAG